MLELTGKPSCGLERKDIVFGIAPQIQRDKAVSSDADRAVAPAEALFHYAEQIRQVWLRHNHLRQVRFEVTAETVENHHLRKCLMQLRRVATGGSQHQSGR